MAPSSFLADRSPTACEAGRMEGRREGGGKGEGGQRRDKPPLSEVGTTPARHLTVIFLVVSSSNFQLAKDKKQ